VPVAVRPLLLRQLIRFAEVATQGTPAASTAIATPLALAARSCSNTWLLKLNFQIVLLPEVTQTTGALALPPTPMSVASPEIDFHTS
jgi:hypothetical protein